MLRLGAREVVPPIEAKQCSGESVRRRWEHPQPPAEHSRGQAQAGDGVARVMLAVAERTLAILPGLSPVHRRKPDERAAGRNGGDYRRASRQCTDESPTSVPPGATAAPTVASTSPANR